MPIHARRRPCRRPRSPPPLRRRWPRTAQRAFLRPRATLTSVEIVPVRREGQVPVSEMFGHMGVLPTFTLHSAGLCPATREPTHFWRVYSLKTAGMSCEITETYRADVLDLPFAKDGPRRTALGHGF